ncbi:MAG: HEAT repeat domain-containing protein [Halobacteriota archaeon]
MNEQAQSDVAESAKDSIVKIANSKQVGFVYTRTRKSVVDALVTALEREDLETLKRNMIIQLLGEIGASEGIEPLLKVVDDDKGDIRLRTTAIESLKKIIEAIKKTQVHEGTV